MVGDSVVDAAICDGDLVTVRRQSTAEPGDIVAAMLDDGEATVKRFQRDAAGHVPGSFPTTATTGRSAPTTRSSSARSCP
ncbi:hypothetical protein GCM10010289_74090 [Streptomyces violascens]|nr:hypothetical protein GCM10010289_74090 [Streptomyces violascens]